MTFKETEPNYSSELSIYNDIREVLGPKVFFHYTIMKADRSEACGGLHKEKADAERIGDTILRRAKQSGDAQKINEWERSSVVELKEKERYTHWPYGTNLIHGGNDGTHNSLLSNTNLRSILRGFVIP